MKKHQFIIVGASTSGKSHLARELNKKFPGEMVRIDPLIDAFEEVFPELNITHRANTPELYRQSIANFHPWISRVIKSLGENSIAEGFRLDSEKLHAEFPDAQFFAFGFPNDTPENHLARVRKYNQDNWTNECDDAYLLELFAWLIDESRALKKLCAKLDVPFFDTSSDDNFWPEIRRALELAR